MGLLLADAGVDPRVLALTRALGIEKSTASRVARGVRAADGAAALLEFPAPEGILKVVAACEARGASPQRIDEVRSAIDELRKCFDEIPGGRIVAVEALRGGPSGGSRRANASVERARVREERAAARAIFAGLRSMHGCAARFQYLLRIQLPIEGSDLLEPASVSLLEGFVRLRPGAPIQLHASRIQRRDEPAEGLRTLEGEPIGFHIERALMTEFCAGTQERLVSRRQGPYIQLELGPADPPIDKPMSVALAFRELARDARYAGADVRFGCIRHLFRRPVERVRIEFMVPRGYLADAVPVFRCSQDLFGTPDLRNGPPDDGRDGIEVSARYLAMGRGAGEASEAPDAAPEGDREVVRRVFERLKLDPNDFDRYRLDLAYPLLGVWNEMWYELPRRGGGEVSGR